MLAIFHTISSIFNRTKTNTTLEKEILDKDPIIQKVLQKWGGTLPHDYWRLKAKFDNKDFKEIVSAVSSKYTLLDKKELFHKYPASMAMIAEIIEQNDKNITLGLTLGLNNNIYYSIVNQLTQAKLYQLTQENKINVTGNHTETETEL